MLSPSRPTRASPFASAESSEQVHAETVTGDALRFDGLLRAYLAYPTSFSRFR